MVCTVVAEETCSSPTFAINVPRGREWLPHAATTTTCWSTGRTATGLLIVLAYREFSRAPGE
eukprot:15466622-Heterocapsa_arctica.AAC.1